MGCGASFPKMYVNEFVLAIIDLNIGSNQTNCQGQAEEDKNPLGL